MTCSGGYFCKTPCNENSLFNMSCLRKGKVRSINILIVLVFGFFFLTQIALACNFFALECSSSLSGIVGVVAAGNARYSFLFFCAVRLPFSNILLLLGLPVLLKYFILSLSASTK